MSINHPLRVRVCIYIYIYIERERDIGKQWLRALPSLDTIRFRYMSRPSSCWWVAKLPHFRHRWVLIMLVWQCLRKSHHLPRFRFNKTCKGGRHFCLKHQALTSSPWHQTFSASPQCDCLGESEEPRGRFYIDGIKDRMVILKLQSNNAAILYESMSVVTFSDYRMHPCHQPQGTFGV